MDSFSDFFVALTSDKFGSGAVGWVDLAALLVRIVIGIVFLVSFRNKIKDVAGFAKGNNLPTPVAFLHIMNEGVGGVAVLLGIFTQIGAVMIMIAMIASLSFHIFKWKSKYWAASGGWEYDLMIFAMSALILFTGGGSLAVYPLPGLGLFPFA
jgi:putative oxidoreductase